MKRKSLFSIVALSLISSIAICAQTVPALTPADDAKPTKSTNFAFNLFKREALDTKLNVVVSPFSIFTILGMVANGAGGDTRAQMAQTLRITGNDFQSFNTNNRTLLTTLTKNTDSPQGFGSAINSVWQSLTNTGDTKLEIANALYADSDLPLKQSFLDLCQKDYLAESHNENFSDQGTVQKINSWCDQKTHGKIKEIISQLSSDDKLVLLNCIYFKGAWLDSFKPWDTRQEDFKLLNGNLKKVPMMHRTGEYGYFKGDGFEVVELPYRGRRKQVMYVFLPARGASFTEFLASFTAKNWKQRTNSFDYIEVVLSMPKYKIEFTDELKKSLTAMGISDAFSNGANFDAMCAKPMKISKVIHKTCVEVDEAGTEAAAAAAGKAVAKDAFVGETPHFTVDRPFVMALADRDTNEILFLGSIVDPTLQ